jgi:hypothetical protein
MTSTPGFQIAGNKLTPPDARLWKYLLSILNLCFSSRPANTDHVLQMSRDKGNLADVGQQAI